MIRKVVNMIFRKSVLIIHGFNSNPMELKYLVDKLQYQRMFDVFTFTLPFHSYNTRLEYSDFINSTEEKINLIINSGYREIYVIGHSMGGVIGCYIASKYKEVKRLVLISPSFHYLAVVKDKINVIDTIKSGISIVKDYKLNNLYKVTKLPINAPIEFMNLIRKCYDMPKYTSVPCLIIWGTKDNVVPKSSVDYVFKHLKSKYKSLIIFKDVNHNPIKSFRREIVVIEIVKFLNCIIEKKFISRKEI